MKRIALAIIAVFLFTACGVDEGTVYDKTYEPAKDWTEEVADYEYSCQYEYGYDPASGQYKHTNVCKDRFVGYKTVTKHKDACYRLYFKNDDGDKGDDCVGSERYEVIEIGDWYEK